MMNSVFDNVKAVLGVSIGDRIKQRREALGISVDDVAKKLGKHRATVYRYESNEIGTLPTDVLEPLAVVLKTTPAHLMGWDEKNLPAQVDEEIWKTICADKTKLTLAMWIAGLDRDQKIQVSKILAAILGKEIPPSALE